MTSNPDLEWALDRAGELADWINRARPVITELMAAYERRVRSHPDFRPEDAPKRPWACMEYVAAEALLRDQPVAVVEINRPADETSSVPPNRSVATISETLSNETTAAPEPAIPLEFNDRMVERLARHIYIQEAAKCKTLEEALYHQSNWRRAIPEATDMLKAAFYGPLAAVVCPTDKT